MLFRSLWPGWRPCACRHQRMRESALAIRLTSHLHHSCWCRRESADHCRAKQRDSLPFAFIPHCSVSAGRDFAVESDAELLAMLGWNLRKRLEVFALRCRQVSEQRWRIALLAMRRWNSCGHNRQIEYAVAMLAVCSSFFTFFGGRRLRQVQRWLVLAEASVAVSQL